MAAAREESPGLPDPDDPDLVPDDASSLEPDRLAYLAEERARRRRLRLRRLVLTRRGERFGLSGPVVVLALLATSLIGALAVVFAPRPADTPLPQPLAAVPALAVPPAATPGAPPATLSEQEQDALLDHRLPPLLLPGDTPSPTALETVRPAVVAVIPPGCACAPAVNAIYLQAREFRLNLWLVAAGDETRTRRTLIQLDNEATRGGARWLVDVTNALPRTLDTRGLTVLTVRSDGVLVAVLRDLPLDPAQMPAMEPVLAKLPTRNR